jgi:hypothetical protein
MFRGKLKENLVRRIQARWRGFACRRHMRQIKRDLKRELAWLSARRMQAAWRGSVARRRCRAIRARNAQRRQEASVRVVQARVRGFLARSWWSAARARDGVGGERSSKAAASVFTAKVALSKERRDQAAVEATCVVEETQAAVAMVQAQIGISTTERAVDDERAAAIRRAKKEQQSAAAGMLAAAQSERRAEVERDRIRVERQASLEEDAAILLQCSWRGRLARRRFSELKRARDRRLAAAAGKGEDGDAAGWAARIAEMRAKGAKGGGGGGGEEMSMESPITSGPQVRGVNRVFDGETRLKGKRGAGAFRNISRTL